MGLINKLHTDKIKAHSRIYYNNKPRNKKAVTNYIEKLKDVSWTVMVLKVLCEYSQSPLSPALVEKVQ